MVLFEGITQFNDHKGPYENFCHFELSPYFFTGVYTQTNWPFLYPLGVPMSVYSVSQRPILDLPLPIHGLNITSLVKSVCNLFQTFGLHHFVWRNVKWSLVKWNDRPSLPWVLCHPSFFDNYSQKLSNETGMIKCQHIL